MGKHAPHFLFVIYNKRLVEIGTKKGSKYIRNFLAGRHLINNMTDLNGFTTQ